MKETISYLFPFTRAGASEGSLSPVLIYECTTLPVKAVFDIAFYFICLKHKEVYRLKFDIKNNGKSILSESVDCDKCFIAEDPQSRADEIAVALNINLPEVYFENEGIYEIEASLYDTLTPMIPASVNSAFFKVKGIS